MLLAVSSTTFFITLVPAAITVIGALLGIGWKLGSITRAIRTTLRDQDAATKERAALMDMIIKHITIEHRR